MENVALYIVDKKMKELEGDDRWRIETDSQAEWVIRKIKEEKDEAERIINTCKEMIKYYEEEIKKTQESLDKTVKHFTVLLEEYFEKVPKKRTKTQESYKLPSATLVRRYPKPKPEVDKEKLVSWLKERGLQDYIEVEEKPKWGEFKKIVNFAGDKVVDENGEVVEGVTLVSREPEFQVKL